MLTLAVTLATLSTTSWTYAEFLADPPRSQAMQPAVAAAPPVPAPSRPQAALLAPVPPTTPPVGAAPSANPIRYRMADQGGQLWEHTDPAILQPFVAARNQQLFGSTRLVVPATFRPWR